MSNHPALARLLAPTCALLALTTLGAAQVNDRCSVSSGGVEGNAASGAPNMARNGRYVVFSSSASNLAGGDTNGAKDVFIRDTVLGNTVRLSTSGTGVQGNGNSDSPRVRNNGVETVFQSSASNLVFGDTNGATDIFTKNWQTGAVQRISITASGGQANSYSVSPDISSDGKRVVFDTAATNLDPADTNGERDVFLRDRALNQTTRLSVTTGGVEGNGDSSRARISEDGLVVCFQSTASNLVPGDTNGTADVFVHVIASGITWRVSTNASGGQSSGDSTDPTISEDGRYVTFRSTSTDLVLGDTNGAADLFVKDRLTGALERANVGPGGAQANGSSIIGDISGDGRYVLFDSVATNLAGPDTNGQSDIYIRDLSLGTTSRVSVGPLGDEADAGSFGPSLSGDGSELAFWSFATNLSSGDTNGQRDAFYVDRYELPGFPYCTAGTSASGCVASMGAAGTASASASSGFFVSGFNIEAQKDGIVFFGTNGAQALSWGNGSSFQCVVPPVKRTPVQSSGGTNGTCEGSFGFDFNTWASTFPAKAPPAGSTVFAQTWFRDPFNTSNQTTSLSNAWQFSVAP